MQVDSNLLITRFDIVCNIQRQIKAKIRLWHYIDVRMNTWQIKSSATQGFFNILFRRTSKKTSKLRVTGFVRGMHQWISHHKMPVTWKMFSFDDVIENSEKTSHTSFTNYTLSYSSILEKKRRPCHNAVWFYVHTSICMSVFVPNISVLQMLTCMCSQGLKARKRIMEEIDLCLKRRQECDDDSRPEDALELILEAAENGNRRLSSREVQDSALEMLFAGHLPTSSAACSLLMFLAANPKVLRM